jgi:hypothetical protein
MFLHENMKQVAHANGNNGTAGMKNWHALINLAGTRRPTASSYGATV